MGEPSRADIAANAAAAGVVAAMAMTGMRKVTTLVGLVRETPPDEVMKERAAELLARLPVHSEITVELAHWLYGAAAGAAFGLVSASVHRSRWAGPVYGLVIWELFELGIAPLLGLRWADDRPATERGAILADHLLYGVVVGARTRAVATRAL